MYCSNCGARLPEGAKFCGSCGARVTSDVEPSVIQSPDVGQQMYQSGYQQSGNPVEQTEYKMKWFKFLIYFSLFAGAVLNGITAVQFLTGSVYATAEDMYETYGSEAATVVYSVFPGLKPIYVIYGLALLALGVFSVYTRFQLSGYKKIGPTCLLALYGAGAVIPILYLLAASSTVGDSLLDSSFMSSVASSVVMIFVNKTYFNKRKSLFVN